MKRFLVILAVAVLAQAAYADKKELKQVNAEQAAQIDSLQRSVADMQLRYEAVVAQRDSLAEELEALSCYAADFKKSKLLSDSNRSYLSKLYSQMDPAYLLSLQGSLKSYADDKEVADFLAEVNAALENKTLYDHGVELLNSSLNSDDCLATSKRIQALKASISKEQYAEFDDNLVYYLTRYRQVVIFLQGVISDIDKKLELYRKTPGNEDLAKEEAMAILNDKENSEKIEKYVTHIPYINAIFNTYVADLKRNVMLKPKVQEEIMAMDVK